MSSAILYKTYAATSAKSFSVYGDTYVAESTPKVNYQTDQYLLADAGVGSREISYLRFQLSGLSGKAVKSAQLKITTANNSSWNSAVAYGVYGDTSDYRALNWGNKTSYASATRIGSLGSTERNKTYYIPLTYSGWKDGLIQVVLAGASEDGVSFFSNNSNYKPQLLLTLDDIGQAPVANKPVVTISGNPQSISSGARTTISWQVTNSPTQCTAGGDGWSGIKASNGSESFTLTSSKVFRISCYNAAGISEASTTVTVGAIPSTPTPLPVDGSWPVNIKLTAPNTSGWDRETSGSGERFVNKTDHIECYAGGYSAGTHYARIRKKLPETLGYSAAGEFWLTGTFELPSNFYEQNESYMRFFGTDNFLKAESGSGQEWRVGLFIYGGDRLPRVISDHEATSTLELWKGTNRLSTGKHTVAIHMIPSSGSSGSWELFVDGVKVGGQTGVKTVPSSVPLGEQVIQRIYGCIDGAAAQDTKTMQVNLYSLELRAKQTVR